MRSQSFDVVYPFRVPNQHKLLFAFLAFDPFLRRVTGFASDPKPDFMEFVFILSLCLVTFLPDCMFQNLPKPHA